MERYKVCQGCLDLFEQPRYLEIGVHGGDTFHLIRAKEKIAVDPIFHFDIEEAIQRDRSSLYYAVDSDRYFQESATGVFDVIFIDGLHTFEQTLSDLLNTLMFIRADSIIIIDDVLPNGHCAAIADLETFIKVHAATEEPSGAWMGDVYRLVYFIAAFMPMWSFSTVAENHGQLIMWREPRERTVMKVEATSRVAYADVVLDQSIFNIAPFETILQRLKALRAPR